MVSQVLIDKVAEPQFNGLPDWQVANMLNAADPALPIKKQDVPTSDVREILLSNGDWPKVVLSSDDTQIPLELRGACIILRDTILHTTTIRTSVLSILTKTQEVLSGLLTAQVISQASYDALMALTDRHPSWAEHNNLPAITARDVGIARGASA